MSETPRYVDVRCLVRSGRGDSIAEEGKGQVDRVGAERLAGEERVELVEGDEARLDDLAIVERERSVAAREVHVSDQRRPATGLLPRAAPEVLQRRVDAELLQQLATCALVPRLP